MFVAAAAGLALALVSARWPDSWVDWLARIAAVAGVSVPVFWLPCCSWRSSPCGSSSSRWAATSRGPVLPGPACLALGLVYSASLARVSRAALLEELTRDYCRTARAKGASRWGVLLDHALPNAMVRWSR